MVRHPAFRAAMWETKMDPEVYASVLPKVKPLVSGVVAQYQVTHEMLISTVKSILTQQNIEPHLQQEYMWYAQKLWKLTQTYRDKALQKEADAIYLYYLVKGRNDVALRAIAASLGIKIGDVAAIISEILAPALIKIVGQGTITTDGSEQTVIEYTGAISTLSGYIDLSNMEDGDEVIVRIYVKITPDGDYVLYRPEVFQDRQLEPALHLLPRLSGYAMKITIQQTRGSYKSFSYLLVRGM